MANALAHDLDHILEHTGEVWDELRGGRLFITGGTGFFGCWLLESFTWVCDRLNLDASISVLTRSPEAFREKAPHLAGHPAVRLVRGDVRSFDFPGSFSHVIHGATDARGGLSDQPLEMFDTIVEGTRHTLDFAVASGAKRFLLLSSGAAANQYEPADLRAVYAEGKRAAELLCSLYSQQHGMGCPIARCYAFVGPYLPLDIHFAIGNFIRDCLDGRNIEIRGDGTPYRSYLYTADLAIWLWTILVRGESGQPYNVGSERAVSIAELAEAVKAATGARNAIRITQTPRPGAAPERYVPETSRTRAGLGLEEWVPLEDAIRRTAEWNMAVVAGGAR